MVAIIKAVWRGCPHFHIETSAIRKLSGMNTSIFPDKSKQPEEQELKKALGGTYG